MDLRASGVGPENLAGCLVEAVHFAVVAADVDTAGSHGSGCNNAITSIEGPFRMLAVISDIVEATQNDQIRQNLCSYLSKVGVRPNCGQSFSCS